MFLKSRFSVRSKQSNYLLNSSSLGFVHQFFTASLSFLCYSFTFHSLFLQYSLIMSSFLPLLRWPFCPEPGPVLSLEGRAAGSVTGGQSWLWPGPGERLAGGAAGSQPAPEPSQVVPPHASAVRRQSDTGGGTTREAGDILGV